MIRKTPSIKLTALIVGFACQHAAHAQFQFATAGTYSSTKRTPVYYTHNVAGTQNGKAQMRDSIKISSVPAQISFTPGLSTQGRQSTSDINGFSLNILGGKTGSVNGFELAGLFNLNKGSVRSLQIAGLFNLTAGYVQGVQIAGLYNKVKQTMQGVQIAGIHNMVTDKVSGVQLSGIYSHAVNVKGVQISGIANYSAGIIKGVQVAGIANISKRVNGVQVTGIVNHTRHLRGLQLGLINIADTSEGYSIGLINVVPGGYHKLAITTNEVTQFNVSLKTGTKKLYSMIVAGANTRNYEKLYTYGAGFGSEIGLRKFLSLNPEVSSQYVYMGTFSKFNLLSKFVFDVHLNIGRHLSVFGGPSFSAWYKEQPIPVPGYKNTLLLAGYNTFTISQNVDGWIGWNAGISFF